MWWFEFLNKSALWQNLFPTRNFQGLHQTKFNENQTWIMRVRSCGSRALFFFSFFLFSYQRMQQCTLNMFAESFLSVEFWTQHSRFYGNNVASCSRLFHTSYRAGDSAVASCQGRHAFLHMCTSHCVGTHMGAWHAQQRVWSEAFKPHHQFKPPFIFENHWTTWKRVSSPIVCLPQDKIWSLTIVCLTSETFFVRSDISL